MGLKELHLAKRMEDLEKRTHIPDVGSKELLPLLETAKTILHAAEKNFREGDEESAYVLFMRYFNLVTCIHKKPDYQQYKKVVRQKLGSNDTFKHNMDKLENLSKSLKGRYDQLNGKPDISSNVKDARIEGGLSASEKFDRMMGGGASVGNETDQSPALKLIRPTSAVSCPELFSRMRESSVLIMDCRPSSDYEQSHLTYKYAFNIPEEIIAPGMSAGKLQDKLSNEFKELWSARCIKDYVVLMDWNGKDGSATDNSPISILRNILQNGMFININGELLDCNSQFAETSTANKKKLLKIENNNSENVDPAAEEGNKLIELDEPLNAIKSEPITEQDPPSFSNEKAKCIKRKQMEWESTSLTEDERTNSNVKKLKRISNNFIATNTKETEFPEKYKKEWDPDVTYRSPIQFLEGGYKYFIMMYPTHCTNPSVHAPELENDEKDLMDDIEYPSIDDITMKDEIRSRSSVGSVNNFYPSPPRIDRASKLAAIRTYEERKKPIVAILKEQEELLEKAQANDEQLEEATKKWETIFALKRKDINKETLTPAEQELRYQILQLESAAEDHKIENNRLRDELEKYKRIEREQKEKLSAKEQANLEQATKQIETKIQERQRLDEQHEREKLEREKQLAIARENKPIKEVPTPTDNTQIEIWQPQVPQFNRANKPQFNSIPLPIIEHVRIRDFSPIPGTVGRGLTGLKNLGNTCYMNSILQCLSNTPQLTEYCITDKYKMHINRDNKTKGQIVEEVAALIKVLWTGNYKCVASKDLRYVMGQYQQIFQGIEQQDSHEFLTILMDWLHSDLQTLPVSIKTRDSITASEKAWLEFTKSKESLILHLFYGQIKSTVKCVQCHKESATYECFSNLSLELPSNGNVCYLEECLAMYFSGEEIHGWNCPNCKQKRDAIKKLDISKLPPVLVIHLKRFYADPDAIGGRNAYKKKQNYVRFPLENLDMTPHIAKSESRSVTPKTYQLYSISNHYGSMESGHYTAFCKSGNYERWFKFDDQVVTQLDASNVVSSAAYILFYTWLPPIQIN